MCYNRRNYLTRIVAIQNIVIDRKRRGVSQEWVFENEIRPTFRISRATFYNYLGINAKKELKEITPTAAQLHKLGRGNQEAAFSID